MLQMDYRLVPSLQVRAGYNFVGRAFQTERYVFKEYLLQDGVAREDQYHVLRAALSFRSWLVADLGYQFAINRSNSYGQALRRHALQAMVTTPLAWDIFLSLQAEAQRTLYEDSIYTDAKFTVDEDNRNALVASISRVLWDHWELELKSRVYLQEFGSTEPYERQTVMLSLAHLFAPSSR